MFFKKTANAPAENSNTNQKVTNETAGWKTYVYSSKESGIFPDISFKYPPELNDGEVLISSRSTNRPSFITDDWGGLIDFNPKGNLFVGGLRVEFESKINNESSFENYIGKQTGGNFTDVKYFSVNGNKIARIRYKLPLGRDESGGAYLIELSGGKILRVGIDGDFKFSYKDDAKGNSISDYIISTFKFTK